MRPYHTYITVLPIFGQQFTVTKYAPTPLSLFLLPSRRCVNLGKLQVLPDNPGCKAFRPTAVLLVARWHARLLLP